MKRNKSYTIITAVLIFVMSVAAFSGCGITINVNPDGNDSEEISQSQTTSQSQETNKPSDNSSVESIDEDIPFNEDDVFQYLTFRNEKLLKQHYEKHGKEMGFSSPDEYEAAANTVIYDPEVLVKQEAEDGDYVYYLENTNEFVVVSTDGYIRTFFNPTDGIEYYNRQ